MTNLMKLMLLMGIAASMLVSISEANTKRFSFGPSDFIVTSNGGLSTAGYSQTPMPGPPQFWIYQLSDTFDLFDNGVILWHTEMLNMNQNWKINFRIRCGLGMSSRTADPGHIMAFLLTTDKSGACYAPGHNNSTSSVFVCEIDTQHDADFLPTLGTIIEGGGNPGEQHCAFIKNSTRTALPGTYAELQNNFAKITTNQWICCQIVYKKQSGGGYRIEFWMQEIYDATDPLYMQLKLRTSYNFNAPSDLLDDIDSTGLAYFGFGADACIVVQRNPNRYEIMFLGGVNGEDIEDDCGIGVRLLQHCNYNLHSPPPFDSVPQLLGSWDSAATEFIYDCFEDICNGTTSIYPPNTTFKGDTIFYTFNPCLLLCPFKHLALSIDTKGKEIDSVFINDKYYGSIYNFSGSFPVDIYGHTIIFLGGLTGSDWYLYDTTNAAITIKFTNGEEYVIVLEKGEVTRNN